MIHHLTAVWKFRHFLMALIKLDLRMRYRRSIFGIGWSLLNPIAMTIVFCVVFSTILGNGRWDWYAPYLLSGMAIWGFVRDGALGGCRSLLNNEPYIRQSPLPYALYSLRTVAGQAIHFAIAMSVVLVLVIALRPAHFHVLKILPAVVPGLLMAFIFAWAVATIMSFINVYFQDTQHLLDVGAQIMFFLTPIMYEPEVLSNKGLQWLLDLNPANIYLALIRTPLMDASIPSMEIYLIGAGVTTAFVGLAWGTVAWLQKRVIFHM